MNKLSIAPVFDGPDVVHLETVREVFPPATLTFTLRGQSLKGLIVGFDGTDPACLRSIVRVDKQYYVVPIELGRIELLPSPGAVSQPTTTKTGMFGTDRGRSAQVATTTPLVPTETWTAPVQAPESPPPMAVKVPTKPKSSSPKSPKTGGPGVTTQPTPTPVPATKAAQVVEISEALRKKILTLKGTMGASKAAARLGVSEAQVQEIWSQVKKRKSNATG